MSGLSGLYGKMANQQEGPISDLTSAAGLLNRVTLRLSSSTERNHGNRGVQGASAGVEAGSVRGELRTLFPHHFGSATGTVSNRSQIHLQASSGSRKRKEPAQKCKEIVRKCVCLADKEQADAPDCEEHRQLLMAGLGEMELSVPEEAEESDIRAVLVANFPKLEFAGGFELMYSESRSRELKLIPPGPQGLTMKYLVSFIGQGKVYIRPIQENLPLEHKESKLESHGQREMCNNCMEMIHLHKLMEHYLKCQVKVSSNQGE